MFESLWVQILAPYTGMHLTFFHIDFVVRNVFVV